MKPLPNTHCHVHYVTVDQLPDDFAEVLSLLPPDEQLRVNRFKFEKDQRQSLAAHLLKRQVLAKYTGVASEALSFASAEYGKPYLINNPQLQFNLTHSQGVVLIAVRLEHPVGVDVELPRSQIHHLELAERFFSASEVELLTMPPPDQLQAFFYRLWVAKEAILKAQGVGITNYLDEVELTMRNQQMVIGSLPPAFGDSQNWHLHEFIPIKNATAAIASPSPIEKVEIFSAKLP